MDALTLAQQIVETIEASQLEHDRVKTALVMAAELFSDREYEQGVDYHIPRSDAPAAAREAPL
jgi:hypothetical protein